MKDKHYLLTGAPTEHVNGYLVSIHEDGSVTHIGPAFFRSSGYRYRYGCALGENGVDGTLNSISFDYRQLCGLNTFDMKMAKEVAEMFGPPCGTFKIKNVIYNDPAVIVNWADGTKTVAKAKDELYDPEKGLAMCFAKKALGNTFRTFKPFKRALRKAPEPQKPDITDAGTNAKRSRKGGTK